MKSMYLKNTGLFVLYAWLMASLIGCGQDNNKVSKPAADPAITNPYINNPTLQGLNQAQLQGLSTAYSQLNCANGRLPDVNFTLSNVSGQGNMVYGTPASGTFPGQAQSVYVGQTPGYAILIITKVTNGQSIGFNATLSLCRIINQATGQAIVGENTPLQNLSLTSALVLSNSTRCQTGSIDAGQIGFNSAAGWLPYNISPVCK